VGLVAGATGFGVGAEDLAGVVSGDLVLVAVGGDDRDVAAPFALGFGADGWLAEGERPWGAVADGGVGEDGNPRADWPGCFGEVPAVCGVAIGGRDWGWAGDPGQEPLCRGSRWLLGICGVGIVVFGMGVGGQVAV